MSTRHTNSGTFQSIGRVAAEIVANPRFQRQVEHLHRLGFRALGEFLAALAVELNAQIPIDKKLSTFAELDREVLEAAGGDEFSPLPIHEVQQP